MPEVGFADAVYGFGWRGDAVEEVEGFGEKDGGGVSKWVEKQRTGEDAVGGGKCERCGEARRGDDGEEEVEEERQHCCLDWRIERTVVRSVVAWSCCVGRSTPDVQRLKM